MGDAGFWNRYAQEVRDSLIDSEVKQLILAGDNLYDTQSSYQTVWDHWTRKGFEFTVAALGNHHRSYQEEMQYFGMPAEYYSKVIGAIRFIVLNSDNQSNVQDQATFLEQELRNSRENFNFVIYHHPPFSLRHTWEERKSFHLAIRPILHRFDHKITALIVGHDHVASLVSMGDIPVIVSGAVFESFNIPRIHYVMEGKEIQTKWSSHGGYYWTRLDINEMDEVVWINFVRSDIRKVDCSVRIFPRPLLMKKNCHL
jgi:predicted phosphodiesterase